MANLSPAAQAVLDAATPALNNLDACGFNHQRYDRKALAAALRAVTNDWRIDTEFIDGVEYIRTTTLESIAAELEGADG